MVRSAQIPTLRKVREGWGTVSKETARIKNTSRVGHPPESMVGGT